MDNYKKYGGSGTGMCGNCNKPTGECVCHTKQVNRGCVCEMPFWTVDGLYHCSKCGGLLPDIKSKLDTLEAQVKALKAENERLKEELGNWRYALAYCSMEEMPTDSEAVIPTSKGVKKFIDELLEEKTRLKHILTARHIKFRPNPVSVEEMAKVLLFQDSGMKWQGINDEEKEHWLHLAQALHDRIYGKGGEELSPPIKDKPKEISDCCKAEVKIGGDTTHYYVCSKCNQPCDLDKPSEPEMTQEEKDAQEWMNAPLGKPTEPTCVDLNYNCTLAYFAEQIGIKLWQAMSLMKYAEIKDKPKEYCQACSDLRANQTGPFYKLCPEHSGVSGGSVIVRYPKNIKEEPDSVN
jgi:hypothetical protein